MKYTDEERQIIDSIENGKLKTVPYDNDKMKQMAKDTIQYNKEKKRISLNIKKADLDMVKQRADAIGISYQDIVRALVHNYTTNKTALQL